ncbi:hypothetical protein SK128_015362 [Halocaridina rubra]|uniref:Uncharacterized protein n=1 Tax=Halocaridina rubra TaxID=373956 RepID=A0AAN8XV85_HALRR
MSNSTEKFIIFCWFQGDVIRQVQGSLQGLEKTVTRHSSHFVALRRNRGGRVPQQRKHKDNTTVDVDSDSLLERPDEDMNCRHPYTRIGLGCFTIHSTLRYSWERARQHCQ